MSWSLILIIAGIVLSIVGLGAAIALFVVPMMVITSIAASKNIEKSKERKEEE